MKIKIKPEAVVAVASIALGVAQALLNNKKDANDRAALKNELKEEIVKDLLKENS